MLSKYKVGLIIGFSFGVCSVFFWALGLISVIAGQIGSIFFFPGLSIARFVFLQTDLGLYIMPLAMVLNGIFYALVGCLLQKWLKKERYVVFVFGGVAALVLIPVIVELVVSDLSRFFG